MKSKAREGSEEKRGFRVKQKVNQFLDLKIWIRSNNQSIGSKITSFTREEQRLLIECMR